MSPGETGGRVTSPSSAIIIGIRSPVTCFAPELCAGEVVRAYAEPIVVADYLPRGLTGTGAAHVQRIAAGLGGRGVVMEDGAVEVEVNAAAQAEYRTVEVVEAGRLLRVAA